MIRKGEDRKRWEAIIDENHGTASMGLFVTKSICCFLFICREGRQSHVSIFMKVEAKHLLLIIIF